MTLTAFQYVLWVAGFVAHASLVVVMLQRASYRRWPSLFSMAIFEMSLTLILFAAIKNHYEIYFYAYWGA